MFKLFLPASLKADPYEMMAKHSDMYIRWYGDQMWLFVPVQQQLAKMAEGFFDYPYQKGQILSVADIGYNTVDKLLLKKKLDSFQNLIPATRQ